LSTPVFFVLKRQKARRSTAKKARFSKGADVKAVGAKKGARRD
jgi:hypothetical protein